MELHIFSRRTVIDLFVFRKAKTIFVFVANEWNKNILQDTQFITV